ncbi:MAG: hypothetical protein QM498_00330 [Desulfobacterium sp.]
MRGNFVCLLALIMIIPACFYFFSKYGGAKAVIIAFFGAVLFLPMEELHVPLILYNKMTAVGIGVMFAIKALDGETLENFSLHPVDYPMLIWLFSVVFSSILNGLGVKDGFQESFNTFTLWGVPYLAGRLYFSDPKGHLLLCQALFICGLIYIPLVAFELVMSPQAHNIVYGYMQHSFAQVIRGGGYRPMVFMQHGIMLGTFMCMAAFVGIWCTATGVFPKKQWGLPSWLLSLVMLFSAIMCKSSGAIGLMFLGLIALFTSARLKTGLLIWMMLLIPPAYISTRSTGYWDGQNAIDLITEKFSEDRAASLAFRFDNENILVEKAQERPFFGWGGWGRARVYDIDTGEDLSTTDGFWVIILGSRGFMGLISVSLVLFLPMLLFTLKNHPKTWAQPEIAPSAVIAIIPLLFLIDCTLNAMVNQMYIIFAGGITGMITQKSSHQPQDQDQEQAMGQGKKKSSSPSPLLPRPKTVVRATKLWRSETRFVLTPDYPGPRFQLKKGNVTLNNQEEKDHGHQKKGQRVQKIITEIK